MRILKSVLAMSLLLAAAPNAVALSEPGGLVEFHGVWIGKSVVAEKQLRDSTLGGRDIDVAIWETETGFAMTWKTLNRDGVNRITVRFVATSEPDIFEVSRVDPALSDSEKLWAQFEGDSLIVYLSGVGDEGAERVARYECSVSDGQMTFKYTLSRGGELLERVTGNLSKAKVKM